MDRRNAEIIMLNEKEWSGKSTADIFEILKTGDKGLEVKEAADRLRQYGANKLPEQKADGYFWIFLRQFQSPLIYILLAAGAAIFAEHLDFGKQIKEYSQWMIVSNILTAAGTLAGGFVASVFGFQWLFVCMGTIALLSFFGILLQPRKLL